MTQRVLKRKAVPLAGPYLLLRAHAVAGGQLKARLLRQLRCRNGAYAPANGDEKILNPKALGSLQLWAVEDVFVRLHLTVLGAGDLHGLTHEALPRTLIETGVGVQ